MKEVIRCIFNIWLDKMCFWMKFLNFLRKIWNFEVNYTLISVSVNKTVSKYFCPHDRPLLFLLLIYYIPELKSERGCFYSIFSKSRKCVNFSKGKDWPLKLRFFKGCVLFIDRLKMFIHRYHWFKKIVM